MSNPQIRLRPIAPLQGTIAAFDIMLTGVRHSEAVTLELHETKFEGDKVTDDRKLGTIEGKAIIVLPQQFSLLPSAGPVPGAVDPEDGKKVPRVALVLPMGPGNAPRVIVFDVPVETTEGWNRANWYFQVKLTAPKPAVSAKYLVSVIRRMLEVGAKATYDWHAHNDVHFYHGGSEGPPGSPGSLMDMAEAIRQAKSFVFVVDWSFHPYFRIDRGPDGLAGTAGRLLLDAANRGVLVAIHVWEHNSHVPDEQSNNFFERIEEIAGGRLPETLRWRLSERTGMRWSHHQKMLLCDIDGPDGKREVKAFFGGCDLTRGRFDWHEHVIMPDDPLAKDFQKPIKRKAQLADKKEFPREYHDWYSAEFMNADAEESAGQGDLEAPREPWHDIHASMVGPGAWDMLREFVGRWNNDPNGSARGSAWDCSSGGRVWVSNDMRLVNEKFRSLFDLQKGDDKGNKFVQQNEQPVAIADRPWCTQVYRSIERQHWESSHRVVPSANKAVQVGSTTEFQWHLPKSYERSIQDAYLQAIECAEEFIYIESQFFISSGQHWDIKRKNVENTLAKAIVDRIVAKKGKPFHCYIVTPMYPEGDPSVTPTRAQRNLEWRTMEYMIGRLSNELGGEPWSWHLSFYFPGRSETPQGGILTVESRKKEAASIAASRAIAGENPAGPRTSDWRPAQRQGFPPPSRKELVTRNRRYLVYVHSKMMIVDDEWIIIGSANLNERSLAGDRDTEICVGMWPAYPSVRDQCKAQIKAFREHLFEEHFGAGGAGDPKDIYKQVQHAARLNYLAYRNCTPMPSGHAMMLPLIISGKTLSVAPMQVPEWSNDYLPDAPEKTNAWTWNVDAPGLFEDPYVQLIVE